AKEVASLDVVTGGRFLFGVGGGWNEEEMQNHGTPLAGRWKLLRERIEAMKAIWTQKQAEYHGERVRFDPIYAWPKPVQKARAPPADPRGRRLSGRRARRAGLRRRLDPDPGARRGSGHAGAEVPQGGRRGRPRPRLARAQHLRLPAAEGARHEAPGLGRHAR